MIRKRTDFIRNEHILACKKCMTTRWQKKKKTATRKRKEQRKKKNLVDRFVGVCCNSTPLYASDSVIEYLFHRVEISLKRMWKKNIQYTCYNIHNRGAIHSNFDCTNDFMITYVISCVFLDDSQRFWMNFNEFQPIFSDLIRLLKLISR